MSNSDYTSVTLVGRSRLFRDGLKSLLAETNYRIVEEAEEVGQIVPHDDRPLRGLILLDAGVRHDGLADDVDTLVRTLPDVPVVVLSDILEYRALHDAMAAGASGYLLKDISTKALVSSSPWSRSARRCSPP